MPAIFRLLQPPLPHPAVGPSLRISSKAQKSPPKPTSASSAPRNQQNFSPPQDLHHLRFRQNPPTPLRSVDGMLRAASTEADPSLSRPSVRPAPPQGSTL